MQSEPPAAALARAQRWLRTVTYRELQSWQAGEPLPTILAAVRDQPEGAVLTRDATFSPGRGSFQRSVEPQGIGISGARYSAEGAEQLLQEVAQRRALEHDPEVRPYADPYYWAGFHIYGW
jgi:CHAT domain-containing protein